MQILDLRVEYRENPIGMGILKPRFSWKLKSEKENTIQTGCQIQVISAGKMIWDSGCRRTEQSVFIEYGGLPLQAENRYEYRVTVWDNHGEMAVADGNFETGLISGGNELKNPKPVELVLKRKTGTELFDQIVIGDETVLCKYKDQIKGLFAENLLNVNLYEKQ